MLPSSKNLKKAEEILEIIKAQKIQKVGEILSEKGKIAHEQISMQREILRLLQQKSEVEQSVMGHNDALTQLLIINLANTYLKLGTASDISARFAFEYFRRFKEVDICLVHVASVGDLLNRATAAQKASLSFNMSELDIDTHMFLLIGNVNFSNKAKAEDSLLSIEEPFSIEQFLSVQPKDCVVVDPLFECIFSANNLQSKNREKFEANCKKKNIQFVYTLERFHSRVDLIKNLNSIEANVIDMAESAQQSLCLTYLNELLKGVFKIKSSNSASWQFGGGKNKTFYLSGATLSQKNLEELREKLAYRNILSCIEPVQSSLHNTNLKKLVIRGASECKPEALIALVRKMRRAAEFNEMCNASNNNLDAYKNDVFKRRFLVDSETSQLRSEDSPISCANPNVDINKILNVDEVMIPYLPRPALNR